MAQQPLESEFLSSGLPLTDAGRLAERRLDRIQSKIDQTRQELIEVDDEMRHTRQEQQQTYGQLQQHQVKLDTISKEADRQTARISEIEGEISSLQDRYQKAAPKYSLFAGLLYFVAGAAFVAGDLIISHEIVAYALNIRNPTEAWFFAVGLAMVSILLKPVYDRLIEGPYLQNQEKSQKIYAAFKVTLAVFSVMTLFILGWFRYEAYRTDKMKQAISQNIKNIQIQQIDPNSAATISQVEKQMQQVDVLNQGLVTSPFALASFVLSGVLFAIAGAVCLGVAFPILQGFWFRWLQAGPRLKRLRKVREKNQLVLLDIEQGLTEHLIQKGTLENKLSYLLTKEELNVRKSEIKEQLATLEATYDEIEEIAFTSRPTPVAPVADVILEPVKALPEHTDVTAENASSEQPATVVDTDETKADTEATIEAETDPLENIEAISDSTPTIDSIAEVQDTDSTETSVEEPVVEEAKTEVGSPSPKNGYPISTSESKVVK